MNPRTKILITVLVLAIVGGGIYSGLVIQNKGLFKGQLLGGQPAENAVEQKSLPDLKANLEIIQPKNKQEDLKIKATIENVGKGIINKGQPFKYALSINDVEVFSNTDSYSQMSPGDSFSFVYPISRSIYKYPEKGTVTFIVDSENSIKEENKENNKVVAKY
ncbi:hypothetical protein HZC20_00685 [Candidatus Peregrinibacteria bacterium]|nr:hypothetical protein [Candidatus Peregrinibacteria bacterium]